MCGGHDMVEMVEPERMAQVVAEKAGPVALEKVAWVAVENGNAAAAADTPQVMEEHSMDWCWVPRGGRWMDEEAVANPLLPVLSL
jgi:hypothetical protein